MAQFIYGKNTVMDAILSDVKVFEVLLASQDEKLVKELKSKNITFKLVSKKELDKLSQFGNHQGIGAKIEDYKYATLDSILKVNKERKIVVILDQIEDPHNFGAIIRTCDAAGVDGIIIQDKRQVQVTPTVQKVATGATNHMKIVQVNNIINAMDKLKENGFWVVGTDAHNSQDYRSVDYDMNVAIVIGSEGNGIRDLVLKNCDIKVKIPMVGTVTSLNASVAAALLIYQAFNGHHPIKK